MQNATKETNVYGKAKHRAKYHKVIRMKLSKILTKPMKATEIICLVAKLTPITKIL